MTTAGSFTETLVEVAEVRLQLRQGGTGEPLLVLHGELGVPGWLQSYELLAEHFTVYAPSLPGFGRSARPDWIASVRDLAAWVTWFVRDLQLPQPLNVIGCSMGGWIAAEIATVNDPALEKEGAVDYPQRLAVMFAIEGLMQPPRGERPGPAVAANR